MMNHTDWDIMQEYYSIHLFILGLFNNTLELLNLYSVKWQDD
jgi:hypothetical protein